MSSEKEGVYEKRRELDDIRGDIKEWWKKIRKDERVRKKVLSMLDNAHRIVSEFEERHLPVQKDIYQMLYVGYCKVNVEERKGIKRRADRYRERVDTYEK